MPYSYYGYGDFLANNIYVILLIPVLLLSVWAQAQVSGSFRRYSRVANRRHLTGAQAAEAVLRSHGIYDVPVRSCRGNLTDHYDPRDNTIYLSENVYAASTVAAVGVACHEAGHAVQYAVGYGPINHSGHTVRVQIFLCAAADWVALVQPAIVFGWNSPVFPDYGFSIGDVACGVQRISSGIGDD